MNDDFGERFGFQFAPALGGFGGGLAGGGSRGWSRADPFGRRRSCRCEDTMGRSGTDAFRIEIGVGLRYEAGVAAFWVFRKFSVGSCRSFLAGLIRMVIRGGGKEHGE